MEQIAPKRRKKNSTRVSAVISFAFHAAVFFFVFVWAAREGVLGTKLQEITVAIVPKEKPPPEPEKPPPPPRIEPPKELPQEVEPPKIVTAPPPPAQNDRPASPPVTAPAPAVLPDFAFSDGAKEVETGTNSAFGSYKNLVEYSLRANWERPPDIIDDSFTADVELHVDLSGRITSYDFKKGSGSQLWDDSVRKAIDGTRSIDRPPPKGFPGKVVIRFDVLPASSDLLSH
jgi:periplasmic protein TonB